MPYLCAIKLARSHSNVICRCRCCCDGLARSRCLGVSYDWTGNTPSDDVEKRRRTMVVSTCSCLKFLDLKPFQCWGNFRPKHRDAKLFENHLNPVILAIVRLVSDKYPCARVSMIFQFFSSFCIIKVYSRQQHKG